MRYPSLVSSRKGVEIGPGKVVLIIAAFFIIGILLGITTQLVGSTSLFMKSSLLDVQANRVVNAGMALDSRCAGGEISFDMSGYSLKINEEEGVVVKYGDETVSDSVRPLVNGYDVIEAPSDFEEIQGDLVLYKEFEDGDEVLVIDTGGGS